MSKRKEKTPAPLADWEVSLSNAEGVASGFHRFPGSRWKRTAPGWYTFTDEQGVVAEFPPGVVLSVIRRLEVVLPPNAGPSLADAVRAHDGAVLTKDGWKPGPPVDAHGARLDTGPEIPPADAPGPIEMGGK